MGKASTKAQNKYIAKAYDRVNLTLPKGRKTDLQIHAEERGGNMNGFIGRAIEEQIKQDTGGPSVGSYSPMLLPETLEAAIQAADATGEDVPAVPRPSGNQRGIVQADCKLP